MTLPSREPSVFALFGPQIWAWIAAISLSIVALLSMAARSGRRRLWVTALSAFALALVLGLMRASWFSVCMTRVRSCSATGAGRTSVVFVAANMVIVAAILSVPPRYAPRWLIMGTAILVSGFVALATTSIAVE